jgi:SET domain-containing protein
MSRSVVVRNSPIHGTGVFAARKLAGSKAVMRYRGEIISHQEADQRHGGNTEGGHTFLFTLNDDYVIDGGSRGNSARWINHSCDPNCEAVLWEDPDGDRSADYVEITTTRAIRRGEELTYDYGLVLPVRHTQRMKTIWACRCGSPNCTGTMLKDKRKYKGTD